MSRTASTHDQSTENCADKSSVEIQFSTYFMIPPTMRRLGPQWRGFVDGADESAESKETGGEAGACHHDTSQKRRRFAQCLITFTGGSEISLRTLRGAGSSKFRDKPLRCLSAGLNYDNQIKRPAARTKCGLVEAPGVEPGSEDRQHNGSTCVADRFSFAATHAHRLA